MTVKEKINKVLEELEKEAFMAKTSEVFYSLMEQAEELRTFYSEVKNTKNLEKDISERREFLGSMGEDANKRGDKEEYARISYKILALNRLSLVGKGSK